MTRTTKEQNEIRLDGIFSALVSVIAFVRPPMGYLESIGMRKEDIEVIDIMFAEYYKPTISFELYLAKKKLSHVPHVKEDCAQWVSWYKEAVEEAMEHEYDFNG